MARVAAILAGLALGVAVLGVVNLNRVIEANRERILTGLSEGFARPVVVERFGIGFDRGVTIAFHGLRIADDPRFSTEDFVVAERAYAVVALWPLLRGEVVLRRIVARAPRITVVRTARGLNVESLGDAGARDARPDDGSRGSRGSHGTAVAAIGLVAIEEGAIRFVDRTATPPRETTIAPLTLELSDLSQTTPVQVELRATVAGKTPTVVRAWGSVGPVGDPPFAAAVPLDVEVAVEGRTVEVAALHATGNVARDDQGRPVASVRVTAPALRAGRVSLRDLVVQIVDRDRVATLERLELGVFSGTVRGTGRLDHHAAEPVFALETRVRDVAIEEALSAATPGEPPRLAGRLETDWTVSGTLGDEVTIRRSLVARGRAVVRQGALTGVNLANRVFARLPAGVPDLIPDAFRQRHPAVFSGDDTRFDELTADVSVANVRMQLNPFVASTTDYRLQGRGTVTFAQHADLAATLTMSEGFTADLLAVVKELRYALGDDGRLAVPFRLVGRLPDVRPKIDDGFVTRVVAKALVGEGLGGARDGGGKGKGKGDVTDRLRRGLEGLLGH